MLLGLISDAIGEYMDGLRQGRSEVIESGHTLILGRSDKLMEVIRQLSLANESEGGGVVVVLNETGKEEVEAEVNINYFFSIYKIIYSQIISSPLSICAHYFISYKNKNNDIYIGC